MRSAQNFRRAARAVALLAFAVVVLGAWVRLTDAGLGCPDWPGCYGRLVVGPNATALADVGAEVEPGKAWREMAHRYVAGALGLAILWLAIVAIRNRRRAAAGNNPGESDALPVLLPVFLVVLVAFQAALGAWTVTLRLQPAVVVAHLLGGFATFALLWLLSLPPPASMLAPLHRRLAWAVPGALVVLVAQIALGGWTSANYAALACPDLPTCHGSWWPESDFAAGFRLWQESDTGFEGGVLAGPARIAIHLTHRVGAAVAFFSLVALGVAILLSRAARARRPLALAACAVVVLTFAQVLLGASNIWFGLPLAVAVAHNAVAALLVAAVVAVYRYAR